MGGKRGNGHDATKLSKPPGSGKHLDIGICVPVEGFSLAQGIPLIWPQLSKHSCDPNRALPCIRRVGGAPRGDFCMGRSSLRAIQKSRRLQERVGALEAKECWGAKVPNQQAGRRLSTQSLCCGGTSWDEKGESMHMEHDLKRTQLVGSSWRW